MKSVLVGINGSATSKIAARQAVQIAQATGAALHFLTVVGDDDASVVSIGSDEWYLSSLEQARDEIEHFLAAEKIDIPFEVSALEGNPAKAIVGEAERLGADLIVVGNVRMQGLGRVLGSVGNYVVHHAPCNVLIVKTV